MAADSSELVSQPHPRQPKAANGRFTVGFLTANIHNFAGRSVWMGVADAAEKHGINFVCFPGGILRAPEAAEARRNVVYDLADAEWLDGLVTWSSAIGGALKPAQVVDFHERYRPLPMVSLAQILGAVPTVVVDSYQGMRAAVQHLIQVHGLRRLAFIRGPESHYYAQERLRAYLDVLRESGIAPEDRLITRPGGWDSGVAAARMLLDERALRPGIDFDAIVAVSDLLALDVLRVLQARGIRVPRDVALVGFNDSLEGRLVTPPLTSVSPPFADQGARALELMIAQLAGEEVPLQVAMPSRLIVRQSCGCPSAAVAAAATGPVEAARTGDIAATLAALHETCRAEMAEAAGGDREQSFAWAGQVLDAFRADLLDRSPVPPGRFLATLDEILERTAVTDGDAAVWQAGISILRNRVLPCLDGSAGCRAEDLFGQARVAIGEAAQRAQAYRLTQTERQAEMLRDIGQALITTFDVRRLVDVLAERLPPAGIASCYLALYDAPEQSLEYAHLVLAYTERGRAALETGGVRFPARRLLPDGVLPRDRPYSLVVEPLFFQETPIGYAVFELGPRDGVVYEGLRGHLSSALKGALLFDEARQARLAAEKADRIKTRLLANVSHELRTPLNIILGYTGTALDQAGAQDLPSLPVLDGLRHIQHSAEHQLRLINDLLDLSRAEIDELDLHLEWLDPRPLLDEAFHDLADRATEGGVTWHLRLPERLPLIQADPVRLRQVLLNLLSNASKFTESGHILLGAEVGPPHLHIWVEDTGVGIAPDQQERVFEPFVIAEGDARRRAGIGLGLSITRHLVALHGGFMTLHSQPGEGSTFHVLLPLPSLAEPVVLAPEQSQPVLLLISAADRPAPEIVEFSRRQGLEIRRLHAGDDPQIGLAGARPAALAWDLASAGRNDWVLVRRLRHHPDLCQVPFVLYGQVGAAEPQSEALTMGLTSFVGKPAHEEQLLAAISAACPRGTTGPILIVDDDAQVRAAHQALVLAGLPGYAILLAADGRAALAAMTEEVPSLVILDLMMPGISGADVLDSMRADPRLCHVPVVVLSNKLLTLDDVKRLERHARVTLQSKGLLSADETVAALERALSGAEVLPPHTSALVKRAVAYLHQNYARPLARWEIAEAVGVSEDYLTRVFSRELGLSPWDFLNRHRLNRARGLLRHTSDSIGAIARRVGFKDQAYFSRVFRKATGMSPQAFRDGETDK